MSEYFSSPQGSHAHSLETLNELQQHDEFMESIDTLIDLGCGTGLDLEWWATRTTRDDDHPEPLNIQCTGVDLPTTFPLSRKYPNLVYQRGNFEDSISAPKKNYYDVLWCHDAFQYAINPIQTLSGWYDIASEGAMLTIILPQTTNIRQHKLSFVQHHGCFYHYTLVNLIHMLAISGWDCNKGFFLKRPTDPWLHAVVYKSQHPPQDPRTANWHKLSEMGLLPESADKGIYARGALHQEDLVLPWLDHSLTWYGQQ